MVRTIDIDYAQGYYISNPSKEFLLEDLSFFAN